MAINTRGVLKQIRDAQAQGYSSSEILSELQKAPDEILVSSIGEWKGQNLSDDDVLQRAVTRLNGGDPAIQNKTMNPAETLGVNQDFLEGKNVPQTLAKNFMEAPQKLLGGTAKVIGNTALSLPTAFVKSNEALIKGGQMAAAGENLGDISEEMYRVNTEPVNVPGLGNLNPASRAPLDIAGQAAEASALLLPYSGLAQHLAGLISPALKGLAQPVAKVGVSTVSGALSGFGNAAQRPGARLEDTLEPTLQGAKMGLVLGSAGEVVSNWPKISAWARRTFTGIGKNDLPKDPKYVTDLMVDEDGVVKVDNQKGLKVINDDREAIKRYAKEQSQKFDDDVIQVLQNTDKKISTAPIKEQMKAIMADHDIPVISSPSYKGARISSKVPTDPNAFFEVDADDAKIFNDLSFHGSRIEGDKAARKAIENIFGKIDDLPDEVSPYKLYGLTKNLEKVTKANSEEIFDQISYEITPFLRKTIKEAVPQITKPFQDYAAFKNNMETLDPVFKKGAEKALMNIDKPGRTALYETLKVAGGEELLERTKALHTAYMIETGVGGPFGAVKGGVAGYMAGSLIPVPGVKETMAVGGSLFGRSMAKNYNPKMMLWGVENMAPKEGALSTIMGGVGKTIESPFVVNVVNEQYQNSFPEITKQDEDYIEFAKAVRQEFPSAPDYLINNLFYEEYVEPRERAMSQPQPIDNQF